VKECTYNKSKISIFFKLYLTQRNEKLRKKYIKKFITPSECLNKYLIDNEYNSICINNPIDLFMTKIEVPKEKLTNRKLIYVGTINENKGILKFLETFIEFSKNNSFEIELFGKISTDNDEEKLNQIISQSQKVKYSGMLSNNDVIQKVQKAYAIVVPSAWMENYPTTVLEAQSNKTLVIGSNRGGIPEMLQDGKGYVFDINSKESIIETLEKIDRLSEESYLEMVNKAYNFVIKNNAYDTYLKKISNVILNTEK
jgi:glycosyltransferase involved in cell wall biosynthesis